MVSGGECTGEVNGGEREVIAVKQLFSMNRAMRIFEFFASVTMTLRPCVTTVEAPPKFDATHRLMEL